MIMKKRKSPVVYVCILIAIVAVLGIGTHVILRYIPTRQQMDLNEYYGETGDGEAVIVIGTEVLEQRGAVYGLSLIHI